MSRSRSSRPSTATAAGTRVLVSRGRDVAGAVSDAALTAAAAELGRRALAREAPELRGGRRRPALRRALRPSARAGHRRGRARGKGAGGPGAVPRRVGDGGRRPARVREPRALPGGRPGGRGAGRRDARLAADRPGDGDRGRDAEPGPRLRGDGQRAPDARALRRADRGAPEGDPGHRAPGGGRVPDRARSARSGRRSGSTSAPARRRRSPSRSSPSGSWSGREAPGARSASTSSSSRRPPGAAPPRSPAGLRCRRPPCRWGRCRFPLRNRLAELILEAFEPGEARATLLALARASGPPKPLEPGRRADAGRLLALGWFEPAAPGRVRLRARTGPTGASLAERAGARGVGRPGVATTPAARAWRGSSSGRRRSRTTGSSSRCTSCSSPSGSARRSPTRTALQGLIQVAVGVPSPREREPRGGPLAPRRGSGEGGGGRRRPCRWMPAGGSASCERRSATLAAGGTPTVMPPLAAPARPGP